MAAQAIIKDTNLEVPINFLVRSVGKPRVDIPEQGQGLTERSGQFENRVTSIKDARANALKFSLDQNGFSFHQHRTGVVDFLDESQVKGLYYPEVEELVKEVTGAKKIHIFDHTIRIEDDGKRDSASVRAPVEVAQRLVTRGGHLLRVAFGGSTVIHSQCGSPLARARRPRTMGGPIDPAGDGVDRRGGTPNE